MSFKQEGWEDRFVRWVDAQPDDKTYSFSDVEECAMAQFLRSEDTEFTSGGSGSAWAYTLPGDIEIDPSYTLHQSLLRARFDGNFGVTFGSLKLSLREHGLLSVKRRATHV